MAHPKRAFAVILAGVLISPVTMIPCKVLAQDAAAADSQNQAVTQPSADASSSATNASAADASSSQGTETVQTLQERNNTLTKLYGDLKSDRDNLLAQSQRLLEENRQYSELKKSYEQFNEEKRLLVENRQAMDAKVKSLQDSVDSLKLHLSQLTQERNELRKSLDEETHNRDIKVQMIKDQLEAEYKGLTDKVNPLKKENKYLSDQLAKVQRDFEDLKADTGKAQQTQDVLKQQIAQLTKQNQDLQAENLRLQEQQRTFPSKFAEMVAQNQKLTEETASMHYNLGVFYVNNREYKRAVEEFDKALELKPRDADTNYNLGYIYAEHLVDRPKAIEYFKRYLTYAPDAADADWVNKYLLTWETWYGKSTMK